MRRILSELTDRGCWISHDRVYVFVSADHGITEMGYHGLQPVSRNSRILVREAGVLTFGLRTRKGDIPLQTENVDWKPTGITTTTTFPDGACALSMALTGRSVKIRCLLTRGTGVTVCVELAKQSTFSEVHGKRTWSPFRPEGGTVRAVFHDRIMLQEWIQRKGPYAGDFMIPEPIRRKIFNPLKRSGQNTPEDLRPEFRSSDMPLYDARGSVICEAEGWSVLETKDAWLFEHPLGPNQGADLTIRCSDDGKATVGADDVPDRPGGQSTLVLPGFPHLEEFAASVPGIMDSCIVHDHGIPRACPGRYYWIWSWDTLVTMLEALRWGGYSDAARTVRFIEQNRDANGVVPLRWTRDLLPLDTPSPGGIEFLQAALAYETFLETGDRGLLEHSIPALTARFTASESPVERDGVLRGAGYYPDLLSAFGRNEQSAPCMETGSWYGFCRIVENLARLTGNGDLGTRAGAVAEKIAEEFAGRYWDETTGFFADSINPDSGGRSPYHPLFALLFLQSSSGFRLIRPHLQKAAEFIAREFLTDFGMRVLPQGETGPSRETVLDSWYPHWDLYALRVLRRAGDAESIIRWLKLAEVALTKLGYCPEFLSLKGFRESDPDKWKHHGSASNLNCITSWHRALREAVLGFECDPGGITHIPLALPLKRGRMDGFVFRGGNWTVETVSDGEDLEALSVDGQNIDGCLKIPAGFYTRGNHTVVARYSNRPMLPCFLEITNALVRRSSRNGDRVEVEIEPLGAVDGAVYSPQQPRVFTNDSELPLHWEEETGRGWFSLAAQEVCTLRLV